MGEAAVEAAIDSFAEDAYRVAIKENQLSAFDSELKSFASKFPPAATKQALRKVAEKILDDNQTSGSAVKTLLQSNFHSLAGELIKASRPGKASTAADADVSSSIDALFVFLLLGSVEPISRVLVKKDTFLGKSLERCLKGCLSERQLYLLPELLVEAESSAVKLGSILADSDSFVSLLGSRDSCLSRLIENRVSILNDLMPRIHDSLFTTLEAVKIPSLIVECINLFAQRYPELVRLSEPAGSDAPTQVRRLFTADLPNDSPATQLLLNIARLAMRAPVPFAVIESEQEAGSAALSARARIEDWSLRSNVKANRRRKAASGAEALLSFLQAFENEDNPDADEKVDASLEAGSSGYMFVMEASGEQIGLFVSFDQLSILMDQFMVAEIGWSAARLMMAERKLNLPPRAYEECQCVLKMLKRQIECTTAHQNSVLRELSKKWLNRFVDPLCRFGPAVIKDQFEERAAENEIIIPAEMDSIVLPVMYELLDLACSHLTPATEYVAIRNSMQLLSELSECLLTTGGEAGVVAGRRLFTRRDSGLYECAADALIDGLLSNWEDVREMSLKLCKNHLQGHIAEFICDSSLMAGNDGVDRLDEADLPHLAVRDVCLWIVEQCRSSKVRDYEGARNIYTLLCQDLLTQKLTQQEIKEVHGVFGGKTANPEDRLPITGASWIRVMFDHVKRQVALGGRMPIVHGAVQLLTCTIDLAFQNNDESVHGEAFNMFMATEMQNDLIKPLMDRMLSLVALGENKMLLSEAVLKTAADSAFNYKIDCRGHLVLDNSSNADDSSPVSPDASGSALIHASTFSRFWVTAMACGDLTRTILQHLRLEHVPVSAVSDIITSGVTNLLGSRHPGLLERWAAAVGTGVLRCTSVKDRAAGTNSGSAFSFVEDPKSFQAIPTRLIKQLLNSILPASMLRLHQSLDDSNQDQLDLETLKYSIEADTPEASCSVTSLLADSAVLDRSVSCFKVIPPPLRKSASLCAALNALLDNRLFSKATFHPLIDESGEVLSSETLAVAILSRLRLLASLDLTLDPARPGHVQEALTAAKFHALNTLRGIIQQRWALVRAAARSGDGGAVTPGSTHGMSQLAPSADAAVDLVTRWVPWLLSSLAETSADFRIASSTNLFIVALQDTLVAASVVGGECRTHFADTAGEAAELSQRAGSDFYTPNVDLFYRRAHHPLARDAEGFMTVCPELRQVAVAAVDGSSALSPLAASTMVTMVSLMSPAASHVSVPLMLHRHLLKSMTMMMVPDHWYAQWLDAVLRKAVRSTSPYERSLAAGLLLAVSPVSDLAQVTGLISEIRERLSEIVTEGGLQNLKDSMEVLCSYLRGLVRRTCLENLPAHGDGDSKFGDGVPEFVDATSSLVNLLVTRCLSDAAFAANSNLQIEARLLVDEILSKVPGVKLDGSLVPRVSGVSGVSAVSSRFIEAVTAARLETRGLSPEATLEKIVGEKTDQIAEEILTVATARLNRETPSPLSPVSPASPAVLKRSFDRCRVKTQLLHVWAKFLIALRDVDVSAMSEELLKEARTRPFLKLRVALCQLIIENTKRHGGDAVSVSADGDTVSVSAVSMLLECISPEQDKRVRILAAPVLLRFIAGNSGSMSLPCLSRLPLLLTDECVDVIRPLARQMLMGHEQATISEVVEWLSKQLNQVDIKTHFTLVWQWLGGKLKAVSESVRLSSIQSSVIDCIRAKSNYRRTEETGGFVYDPDTFFDDEADNNLHADVALANGLTASLVTRFFTKGCAPLSRDGDLKVDADHHEQAFRDLEEFHKCSTLSKLAVRRATRIDLTYPTVVAIEQRQALCSLLH